MGNPGARICCLLLFAGATSAQEAQPRSADRLLPQWLTGIIAVTCFLLLTFISFLVKKIWCEKPSRRLGSSEESGEAKDAIRDQNPYDSSLDGFGRTNSKGPKTERLQEDVYETSLDVLRTDNSATYESSLDVLRSRDNRHAYNNLVMAPSEDRQTAM